MKRLVLLVALVMAMAVLAPAAFADDDTDDVEGADVEMDEKDPFEAQLWKAQMIAEYFTGIFGLKGDDTIIVDDVALFRTGGDDGHLIGWGALFQLMRFAGPDGFDPDAVEGGWAIGQLRKTYLDDPAHNKSDLWNINLGQLHRADKSAKPDKTMPEQAGKKDKTGD
jgi:hypothetical protein